MAQQLTFDLGHRPALGREDFLVAPSNAAAVALIDAWPRWPHPVAALAGPAASGKPPLGQVWRGASGPADVDSAALRQADLAELSAGQRHFLVGGCETALAGDRLLSAQLFHLHNMVREMGGSLLLIGEDAPARWACDLPDLRSRLAAVPVARLGPPDDSLIAALLVKQFSDRQLTVRPEIISYLLPRLDRSFAAVRDVAAALDQASLARKQPITLPLVREVLAGED